VDVAFLSLVLGVVLAVALIVFGTVWLWRRSPPPGGRDRLREDRDGWTMPPLALLDRPAWSPMRSVAVGGLRVYLVIAVLLLAVKSVQLALGHQ
jgi:hypothetical protein